MLASQMPISALDDEARILAAEIPYLIDSGRLATSNAYIGLLKATPKGKELMAKAAQILKRVMQKTPTSDPKFTPLKQAFEFLQKFSQP